MGRLPAGTQCGPGASRGTRGDTPLSTCTCTCLCARALASCVPREQPSPRTSSQPGGPQETATGSGHARCGSTCRPGTESGPRKLGQSKAGQALHTRLSTHPAGQGHQVPAHPWARPEPECTCPHVCAHVCMSWGHEQGPRLQLTALAQGSGCPPVPQALTWLRAALASADSRPPSSHKSKVAQGPP